MKVQDTNLAYFEFEGGVLYARPHAGIFLDVEEMKKMLESAVTFTEYNQYYAIIDTTNDSDSTKDAREYYSNNEFNKYRLADAFIVKSLPLRMVINFFIRMNKPKVPTKMFTTKEQAIDWISELKEKAMKNKNTLLA
jgi:hypothetical protein